MCSELWINAIYYASAVGIVISWILNTILFLFLRKTKTKTFGNYKYLMIAFAGTGIFYSTANFVATPNVHITKSSFYVFTALKFGLPMWFGTLSVTVYCSCYATMLALLGIQFYYRFTSVTAPMRLTMFFGWRNITKWALVVIGYTLAWALTCFFLCGPTERKDNELKEEILKEYCMTKDEYAYVGAQYYYIDPVSVEKVWHIPSIIGMSTFFVLMLITFVLVIYFGIRIYQALNESGVIAYASKELQKQFFETLVIQTVIPFFFMYVPVTCLFLFPITGWMMHGMQNWIPLLVAIFPCSEPMVALICMDDFRKGIYNYITCFRNKQQQRICALPLSISEHSQGTGEARNVCETEI